MSLRHVVIIGPQGAGKGTQAARIAPKFNLTHLSTGDLFRAILKDDSSLSREVRGYMDRGDLVPDDLTARILFDTLDERVADQPELGGSLLDGYPRNDNQADVLEQKLGERGEELAAVIHLDVPRAVLEERIHRRAREESRSDDNEEALRRRLEIYFAETQPLLDRWRARGLVLEIDGDQAIDDVTAAIVPALEARLGAARANEG